MQIRNSKWMACSYISRNSLDSSGIWETLAHNPEKRGVEEQNVESKNNRLSTAAGIGDTGIEINSWRYIVRINKTATKNMKSKYHADRELKYQADEESKGTEARKRFDKAGRPAPAGGEEAKSFNNRSQREETKGENKRKRVEKHVALRSATRTDT